MLALYHAVFASAAMLGGFGHSLFNMLVVPALKRGGQDNSFTLLDLLLGHTLNGAAF